MGPKWDTNLFSRRPSLRTNRLPFCRILRWVDQLAPVIQNIQMGGPIGSRYSDGTEVGDELVQNYHWTTTGLPLDCWRT
eukprot:1613492-Pyramimonas_sp.AAC.1